MARVLLGWELGRGPSYAAKLRGAAEALIADGHVVTVALQRGDVWRPIDGVAVYQAPVWPGLLINAAQTPGRVSTMADILARLGLARAGVLSGLIGAWDAILASVRPDLVVACFAPALLNAARGRTRLVSAGVGFNQPPGDVAKLMRFNGDPGFDEAALLDTIDAELRLVGRETLPALPALFAADAALVASFVELDPYGALRLEAPCRPGIDDQAVADGSGQEVFVYANAGASAPALWDALRRTRLPVRAHVAETSAPLIAALRAQGTTVETRPVRWAEIADRSRVIVSHGGHGTACAALAAGVPHVMLPHDLEKRLIATAIEERGAGVAVAAHADAKTIATAVRAAYDDAALGAAARAGSAALRTRGGAPLSEALPALARA